jgi:cytochrome c556
MSKVTRSGLAIVGSALLAGGVSSSAQESAAVAGPAEPLVSIMELMQQTITPATNRLWSAYQEPSTPAEWRAMEEAAITLLAASSLTATGGTGPMDEAWVREPAWQAFNQAMIAAGRAALDASRNRDIDGLLAAGDLLLPPCEGCHQRFNPAVIDAQ